MFERYTEKARRAIFFARYEAAQLGSSHIGSEHLLLGLMRESKALSAKLHTSSTSALDDLRQKIEERAVSRKKMPMWADLPINQECQSVLLHASKEAERLGHKYVGTEHLVIGMLLENQCYAADLLHQGGLSLETARQQMAKESLEEIATPPQSPGIPIGSSWQQLLYNPVAETIVVEMKSVADRPLPPLGRLFMRPIHGDAYERIGDPADNVSFQNPVTCDTQPVVVFNSIKWDKVKGGGNPDGVYAFNLQTRELWVCVDKDALTISEPHQRLFVSALISLSNDGETLHANVAVEKEVPNGAVVHYYLARIDLREKQLELLSPLKDIRF